MTIYIFIVLFIWLNGGYLSEATNNTLTQGQLLRDGQTILSPNQNFELGFFSSGNSTLRYLGIWYYGISVQTVVWVANIDNPISGDSGVLSIRNDGNLIISYGNNSGVIWFTNTSSAKTNTTAVLTDIGDFVLLPSEDIDDISEFVWKSFSYPSDTYLPDMRAYTKTGESRIFNSWRSDNDPARGNYSMGLDSRGSLQIVVWDGPNRRWRSGHWNGLVFIGIPIMRALFLFGFRLTNDGNGTVYFTYAVNSSLPTRFRLRWNGFAEQLVWDNVLREWNTTVSFPSNECDFYNRCGNFALCGVVPVGSPMCNCIHGFEPANRDEWHNGNWSSGCVRRTRLECGENGTSDGFLEVEGVKLPDYGDITGALNHDECEEECLRNCSCNAYTYVSGIGCMVWSDDLVDVEHFEEGGKTFYVRLANSELGGRRRSRTTLITIAVVFTFLFVATIFILCWFREKLKECSKSWTKSSKPPKGNFSRSNDLSTDFLGQDELSFEGKEGDGPHFPLYNFNLIEVATENFASKNKLGQGGFGPVYKGILPGEQEVAVKRLSKWSGQGLEEFKNEMILIAKLQHRNLVRLLGCSIEGQEKLLIYEYMPNKSLDSFLFDPAMKAKLDWSKRFAIIEGIARGLLYLHRDSRLRVIHRDLKASNILLDEEMNPKIADFGMARIFGGNQNEANTNRVVGTYGYMSPEYAMEGLFSVKSDVYSFGVLLLEIVSSQRNNSFRSPECSNLIQYAWNLWTEGKTMELIDPSIAETCSKTEVLQCIHVAMLCVQVSAAYRPEMSSVMLMLESENGSFPMPIVHDVTSMSSIDMGSFMQGSDVISSSELTITQVVGR